MPGKNHSRCLVCDDISIGINFGVATCMPCKAFFRRNANRFHNREFVCNNDGACLISYKFRRSCNWCRLEKCFRVGMKKSFILTDEEREARNKLVTINRLKRGKIPKIQTFPWMRPPALIHIATHATESLSSSDQALLINIYNAYENTCGVAKNTTLKDFPVLPHTSIHGFVNEMSSEFEVCIAYLKLIPEFNNIIMDDKVRLIKNHIGTIVHIHEPLMHPMVPNNLAATWMNIFNLDITQRLLKRHQIIEQYMVDPVMLKIVLIILVLSSSNCRNINNIDMDLICDNPLAIFNAQNFYIELLWRYILSRSLNEKNAVKFLNRLMIYILFAQNLHLQIDDYVDSLRHEIEQMEPIMQNMWPRTNDSDISDMEIAQDITL